MGVVIETLGVRCPRAGLLNQALQRGHVGVVTSPAGRHNGRRCVVCTRVRASQRDRAPTGCDDQQEDNGLHLGVSPRLQSRSDGRCSRSDASRGWSSAYGRMEAFPCWCLCPRNIPHSPRSCLAHPCETSHDLAHIFCFQATSIPRSNRAVLATRHPLSHSQRSSPVFVPHMLHFSASEVLVRREEGGT